MNEELFEPWFRKMRVNKILPWIPENSILCDIGCGFNAHFLTSISPLIQKGYGFDKKVTSIEKNNLIIQKYNLIESLPVSDNSMDCVTLLAVLEHLSNPDEVFLEIKRICRPKGRVIITTPTPASKPLLEFLSFKMGLVSPEEILDHKHYWTLEEIKGLLNKFGFDILEMKTFALGFNSLVIGEKTH